MPTRPEIFISAASRDLKSCRQQVRDALLTLGCVPVVQDHFPPGAGEVRAMLRERIAGCQAVIHLAGECYGFEPQERSAAEPRRSYTQLEYDIARELKKPLYTFLCAPGFPYDAHDPEPEELLRLQEEHRAALTAGDHLYQPIRDTQELNLRVRELQTRVETLSRDLQKTRAWLGRGLAAALVALALVGGTLWLQHRRATQTEQKVAGVSDELDRYRQAVKALADSYGKDIEPGRKLTEEEKFERALSAVAAQQKMGVGELKTWLALFVAQVRANPGADFYDRALADFAEKHFADAAANAGKAADQYRAQREAAEKEITRAGERAEQARLNERRARALAGDAESAAGHYAAAIEPYRQALALIDENKEPLPWCEAEQNFEIAVLRMGRYADAVPLARAVVEKRTALQGQEASATLKSVNYLVNALYFKGDLPEAETLGRHCLEVRERTLGKEHPDTLESVNKLANVLGSKGDLSGAETLYRRCLEVEERTLGPDDASTLASVNNLAILLYSKGDLQEAETLDRRCLEGWRRTAGPEHPSTLASANNLAQALYGKGDLPGAGEIYRQCMDIEERTLGKEHPTTLLSAANLATVLEAQGDLAGAETLDRRCLDAQERTLGKEHPSTLLTVNNLAEVLCRAGNLSEAETLDRRGLEAADRTLGKEHPITVYLTNNLGEVLTARGGLPEAETLLRRCLAMRERRLGKQHAETAITASDLSQCLDKQGRTAEALALAEEAVTAAAASLPPNDPDRLRYEQNLRGLRAEATGKNG